LIFLPVGTPVTQKTQPLFLAVAAEVSSELPSSSPGPAMTTQASVAAERLRDRKYMSIVCDGGVNESNI
jgi:hypothetical protein